MSATPRTDAVALQAQDVADVEGPAAALALFAEKMRELELSLSQAALDAIQRPEGIADGAWESLGCMAEKWRTHLDDDGTLINVVKAQKEATRATDLAAKYEGDIDRISAYAGLFEKASFNLTAALAQMGATHFTEDGPEYLPRERIMELVTSWRMAVDAASKNRRAALATNPTDTRGPCDDGGEHEFVRAPNGQPPRICRKCEDPEREALLEIGVVCKKCSRPYQPEELFDLGVCCICWRDLAFERVFGPHWREHLEDRIGKFLEQGSSRVVCPYGGSCERPECQGRRAGCERNREENADAR